VCWNDLVLNSLLLFSFFFATHKTNKPKPTNCTTTPHQTIEKAFSRLELSLKTRTTITKHVVH